MGLRAAIARSLDKATIPDNAVPLLLALELADGKFAVITAENGIERLLMALDLCEVVELDAEGMKRAIGN